MVRTFPISLCIIFLGVLFITLCWLEAAWAKSASGRSSSPGRSPPSQSSSSRSSSSRSSSGSSSRTSYGSSARSGSGWSSSGSSGGRATSWGSSAPTGRSSSGSSFRNTFGSSSRNSYSSSSASPAGPSPTGGGFRFGNGYFSRSSGRIGSSPGTISRSPSYTSNGFVVPGIIRTGAAPRPQVHPPSANKSMSSRAVYSPAYNTHHSMGSEQRKSAGGEMLLAGGTAAIGAYYLGRTMSSLRQPPYHAFVDRTNPLYGQYVPFRDKYKQPPTSVVYPTVFYATSNQPTQRKVEKQYEMCTLARWNRELPFTELPNMMMHFLTNDNVSGNTTEDKSGFLQQFLQDALQAYNTYNSSADVFTLFAGYDLAYCRFQNTTGVNLTTTIGNATIEEPLITAMRHIFHLYANSTKNNTLLQDTVTAMKNCAPGQTSQLGVPMEMFFASTVPCQNFALGPEDLLNLTNAQSVFGNSEICHRRLNPTIASCAAFSYCNQDDLIALNLFARNFYLCEGELDEDLIVYLQKQEESRNNYDAEYDGPTDTSPQSGPLTVLQLLFVTVSLVVTQSSFSFGLSLD
ncbi:hypothetical protein RvY_06805 [Ramazzottius varieornatus]|uniref:Uncharacterized protein n=1 Tax=Ramazzottius varieornatus TaxID=947166 RepID=A0A1D1V2P9_RAMVA|nr:hypothetical protein RvY_06805 [Ramazzottius varieornatus]